MKVYLYKQNNEIIEIEGFSLTITADKELLTPQYKH